VYFCIYFTKKKVLQNMLQLSVWTVE